uniref:Odorant receptor n=1 Tax=Ceracris kiangsu TaxID=227354 RepID=A0A6M6DSW9_CERKI|nr:odorant receptor 54 [Ceracris kiangsu]
MVKAHKAGDGGKRLRTDLRLQQWLLRFVGAWAPRRGPSTSVWWRLYGAYSACIVAILMLFVASLLFAMVHYWGQMLGVTMNACLMFTYVMNIIKIVAFLRMRPAIDEFIDELDRCLQEFGQELRSQREVVFRWIALKSRIVSVARLSVTAMGCVYWSVMPAVRARACGDTVQCRARVGLPAHVWYPFSYTQSPVYEVIYAEVAAGLMYGALLSSIMDGFLVSLFIYMAGHLQLLNLMLRNMCGGQAEDEDHHGKRPHHLAAVHQEQLIRWRLAQCVTYHCHIDRSVQRLSTLFGPILLGQFLMDIIAIAATAFVAIAKNADSTWLVKYTSYLSAVIQQLLFYCWFGTDVLSESERLQTSAYSSDWVDASPRFRMELRIFLCRTHRPMRLTASKFYTISRETFLMLMNASLSYFAVLREINAK